MPDLTIKNGDLIYYVTNVDDVGYIYICIEPTIYNNMIYGTILYGSADSGV